MGAVTPMEAGRISVRKHMPYLYRGVCALIPYPTEEVDTLGVTEGMVVYYNPKLMDSFLKEPQGELLCGGVLVHEAMHPLQRHAQRRGGREPELWNDSGDSTINPPILASSLRLPDWVVLPQKFGLPDGQTAEWYYDNIPRDRRGRPRKIGAGQCGGCAGNPGPNAELERRIDEEMGRSAADRERIVKTVANDVRAHALRHGRGSVPGALLAWAEVLMLPPKVRWEAALTSVFQTAFGQIQAGGQDFSIIRPSKRSIVRGLIRPGLVDYNPEVAVLLDTSGSMGPATGLQIQSGLREMAGILRVLGLDALWFLQADAAVALSPRRITIADLRRVEIRGGGGTDFGPALRAAAVLNPRPNIIVYFTDGDGWCPPQPPPGITVIWAIVPGRYSVKKPLPWGKTIWIEE